MKNRKKIIVSFMIVGIILLMSGLILVIKKPSIPNNKIEEKEMSDQEKDLINIDKYYLERNDSKVKSEHVYGDFTFYDVTFSGSHENYLFQGMVKNNGKEDIESITFNIEFLDSKSNVQYKYSGITSFDLKSKIALLHIETKENIALYYDYRITDIKIN